VDGGGQISLAGLKADIRLVALTADRWAVSIADDVSKDLSTRQALDLVAGILQQLANLGFASRAADLAPAPKPVGIRPASSPIGTFALQDSSATGIALPFGSATADASISLANAAEEMGITEFRLAPYHGLLAIDANKAFTEQAAQLGFLTKPHDPRTRISACIGSDGCASGHVPARAVAARLAPYLPANDHLHVSGCAKGCAHPRPAGITLVGRADGYGLVIGGKAGDTPQALMQADQLESTLAAR
jgi:precorrin-3B synthase